MECFLRTEQLGFRKWKPEDLNLAEKLWGDHEVTKFFDSGGKFSKEKINSRLQKEIESEEFTGLQYWPIFLQKNNEFVGCCGLRPYDMSKMILEIGIHLLPVYWGKGFAKEALLSVMHHAFNKVNANALFAGHNPENKASEKLIHKLGFKFIRNEFYEPTGLMHPSYLLNTDDYNRLIKKKFLLNNN